MQISAFIFHLLLLPHLMSLCWKNTSHNIPISQKINGVNILKSILKSH